jgi:hypothetical protein
MRTLAGIVAVIGGLSIVMGILDVLEVFRESGLTMLNAAFWLLLAIALFLTSLVLLQLHRSKQD